MRVTRFLILVTILVLFSIQNMAQLPFITDNSGTVGQWTKQIEMSYGIGFDNGHRCTKSVAEISPVLTVGVHDKVDIVLGYPYLFLSEVDDSVISRYSGFSDLCIEVKYRFLDYKFLSLAIKPGISFPTGNYKIGLGNGRFGYSAFLITTLSFNKIFVHSNLGYIRNENRCGDAKDIWHASIGLDYNIRNGVHAILNAGAEKNPDITSNIPSVFTILGLYCMLNEHVEISVGYKLGCTEPETKHSFIAGLTFRF